MTTATLTPEQAQEILALAHSYADARVDFMRGRIPTPDAATASLMNYVFDLAYPGTKGPTK